MKRPAEVDREATRYLTLTKLLTTNVTLKELADDVGISAGTIMRWRDDDPKLCQEIVSRFKRSVDTAVFDEVMDDASATLKNYAEANRIMSDNLYSLALQGVETPKDLKELAAASSVLIKNHGMLKLLKDKEQGVGPDNAEPVEIDPDAIPIVSATNLIGEEPEQTGDKEE